MTFDLFSVPITLNPSLIADIVVALLIANAVWFMVTFVVGLVTRTIAFLVRAQLDPLGEFHRAVERREL